MLVVSVVGTSTSWPAEQKVTCSAPVFKDSKLQSYIVEVRMAERSKALRSGRSPLLWAWVRIPLLTKYFLYDLGLVVPARVGGYEWAVSVVVITSALHAEGRQFEPGTAQML